jgi:hypothetical protein
MRPNLHACLTAIKIVLVVGLVNVGLAFVASTVGVSARSAFGDLLMLEAALFFMLGGILDFVSSSGAVQLRRMMFRDKSHSDPAFRAENERRALVLVITGIILLAVMVGLAAYDLTVH